MTHRIKTLSIMTLNFTTLSIMMLNIIALSTKIHMIKTPSIVKSSLTTVC